MSKTNLASRIGVCGALLFIIGWLNGTIAAQTTVFTVQGVMTDGGTPANGTFDLEFKLFDALNDGNQIGDTLTIASVQTDGGAWRANLDFGAAPFPGADRFLEVSYTRAGEGNFTTILPRRLISGIPYAIRTLNAANADLANDAANLGGTAASQFVQTDDSRLSDTRVPLPGSNDYIQNATSTQPSASFNIAGTGTANIVNAISQFNLSGVRVLFNNRTAKNLFVGNDAGPATTSSFSNTFVGTSVGNLTTTGSGNSFFGSDNGRSNTSGGGNSFFGDLSGRSNTSGLANSFFGHASGSSNSVGSQNSFFGSQAGFRNTGGIQNSFFGENAGTDNTTGSRNIAIGNFAGQGNSIGSDNIFIGRNARTASSTTTINNSIAIGTTATVSKSNSIVLGTASQETQVPGRLVVGTPFSTGGPLPGRGYAETFFQTNIFQGIYTPNVLLGSYANNPRGTVRPCVLFQTIPGLATGVTLTNCVSSFSSVADKTDVKPFTDGLAIIQRLRPVAFKHKENGMHGLGLNTEDVADVDASLIVRDDELSVTKVNESDLIVLLINSVKQQNARIEAQGKLIDHQELQIYALKRALCSANPQLDICERK